ncbi:MAG: putative toxin-antitoxin system toxin component, PIN family [Deltaproteobacteria bacterium RBG_16_49_23]|nr:MAG: putative toxin-antitoxin system toxin component, PIN family [Deltaproteobacteria bacterium RBG_16_49_23]
MKVVFDTNIFISAFAIPGGRAEEAYLLGLRGRFTLYTSVPILTETAEKLREKFGWEENKIIQFLRTIRDITIIVKPRSSQHLLSDKPDNRILECAEEAMADFIVTGDKHLLSLRHFKDTDIITLSDFIKSISE